MKKICLLLSLFVGSVLITASCSKDEPKANPNTTQQGEENPTNGSGGGNQNQNQEEVDADVSFTLFDLETMKVTERYKKGQEIIVEETEEPYEGMREFITPYIFVTPNKPSGLGNYKIVVSKEDHLEDSKIGITTLCADGQCMPAPKPKKTWDTPIKIVEIQNTASEQSLQVHFGIPESYTKEDSYKMRISLFKDSTEVNYIVFKFVYKPAAGN